MENPHLKCWSANNLTEYGDLPFASIKNEHLRLNYLTTTGPRIVGLYVSGAKGNLLASTPEVHWETPYGEYPATFEGARKIK